LCRRFAEVHLTQERSLGIVKMPALGLNDSPGFARIFPLPFRNHVVVGLDFKQAPEDEGKALGGRFLERQNLDVIIVEAEVPPVAFKMGLG